MNAKNFRLTMILLAIWGLAGCAVNQPVQLEPTGKAASIAPRFSEATYYYDQDKNLYFVLRSHTVDHVTGKPVDQIATIRVFWRPRGGVTTLNSSALDATFRYIVMTPDAVGLYEGAGFVRLLSKTGVATMHARITDGELRLAESSNHFVDTLGRAHIHGNFTATYDDARTVDGLLNAQREFFARSLKSAPETKPASAPATEASPTTAPAVTPSR